ncbi:XapX domain-containing protein [Achromobacter mucicolens]|uniref:XapX domain-containing protein n=1 Tax=Achromobacter mucicolens TaxID=1389922 RepID=UPI003B9BED6E
MKVYLVSLGLGLLVGIIYALFNVRSPAPPVIALVGLLGILAGEQIPPLIKRLLADEPARRSFIHEQVKPHMFGELPSCPKPSADTSRQPADACGDKRNG